YSSDDSDDSMVIESDEISCEYFNGQIQEVSNMDVNPSNGKSLDFSYLDDYKCHFYTRYVCNCWASHTSIDVNDDDDYYGY
ncbi:3225_t:CDS:2, partial [Gigaspora margarita]